MRSAPRGLRVACISPDPGDGPVRPGHHPPRPLGVPHIIADTEEAGFYGLGQQNYTHYIAGMKAWMAEHPDDTPDWAPDLEPWDPVVLSRFMLWPGCQAGQGLQD